ncbi:Bcl-2 homologous antagonist/killer [Mizuhopecten yessoensis]|uniref:Bcl-2 homologous antagonist/killer n=2 Tax=Mizuhopecten yessoensis TaxID=6573 RepID=A0A210QM51_MIZYE|nr:Bcl-2 homologous antagonist/killer [Mizuhopecten yessoensis]
MRSASPIAIMATWDGGGGGGRWNSPDSPTSRQVSPGSEISLRPDTEENVVNQAEDVIRNFMYQRYQQDQMEEDPETMEQTPAIPELVHFTSDPMSQASQVGRQLARIGDDINRRYADEFNDMIGQLNITEDTAYEVFAGVARKLFSEGINWGRVSALLCFAYRIAMKVLRIKERASRFADFLRLIINHVVRFIKEMIASWIAHEGGWVAALKYIPSVSLKTLGAIAGICFLAIGAVFYFNRKGS